jgi:hypothetical protein
VPPQTQFQGQQSTTQLQQQQQQQQQQGGLYGNPMLQLTQQQPNAGSTYSQPDDPFAFLS